MEEEWLGVESTNVQALISMRNGGVLKIFGYMRKALSWFGERVRTLPCFVQSLGILSREQSTG